MIYIILWPFLGLLCAAGMGYYRYHFGEELTLTKVSQLVFAGLIAGPFVGIALIMFAAMDFYMEHGDKVLFKKDD